ncbi:peptide MFS transporter [Aquicella lusitana]|uniref:POT family proton-dependent oligopeptide transporter n=1 Tax=Aquicella lusitana TaxID=254246 RepID=A0A370GB90_9COXI|nr:oligopeptide:H+ symporter [Aquicella lusitana]RDI40991.1 POT family proton-dependent oligopeptide transporter [Aquicella lusitana]VVC73604.1 Dipeptide and tripeptide permease A [Aquicella lusitana]
MSQTRTKKTFYQKYQDVMPTGAGALFLIQIFATLGFSVLYSTLILYATQGLHMNDLTATSITGSFVALNYFLHLLGGYMGGRFMSYRSLFGVAMLLQVTGCVLISVPDTSYLLWGLSFFLAGSGLNVTCINCMVTQLFEPDDKRREAAFLWNYSGMNIGFFVGFTIGGYFHLHQAYHQLFLLSALGNLIALVLTLYNWKLLKDRDTTFVDAVDAAKKKARLIGIGIVIALVFALRGLLNQTALSNQLILIIGAAMLALIIVLTLKQPGHAEKNKMSAYIILALASLIFWALYQLAPMGLNLFIERNVDRHFLGILIAPQWVQNINTVVIIFGGPLLSVVFSNMRERGININIPLQFSFALLLIGIAFAILPVGIGMANAQGYTNFNWVLVSYVLQSVGELFISPIGYAMVGQLAPLRLRGLMMGMWMMITGVAAILSDHFSKMALGSTESIDPLVTNASYSHTFGMLGWSAIVIGIALLAATPVVARLTQEKKSIAFKTDLKLQEDAAG